MKSGNGTFNKQYIYCLWHFPWIFLFKIGITGNMRNRVSEINKTTFGVVVPVFFCRVWGAYYLEQFLLNLLRPLKWELNCSGGTEFRLFGIIALPALLLAWILDRTWLFFISLLAAWFLGGCPDEPLNALARLIK